MKEATQLFKGLLISAFMLAGMAVNPAMAQDKAKGAKAAPAATGERGKPTVKVLVDNDKVRVVETTYKPGDEGDTAARGYRVTRVLKGGTMQRTHADGKVEKFERKTGEVRAAEAEAPYKVKNIGKTDVVNYTVQIKESKK